VCAAFVPVISRFARRRGLFDHISSSRKVHSSRIPRLGGLAIVAGFYAPLLALILYPTGLGGTFYSEGPRAFAFLFGGLAIAALGLFDDSFGAGAAEKFSVEIAVALYLWWAGFRIDDIQIVGGTIVSLGSYGGALLTVVWIVGVMNALNLIDSLDSLAAGIAVVSAATNFTIAFLGRHVQCALEVDHRSVSASRGNCSPREQSSSRGHRFQAALAPQGQVYRNAALGSDR
jgi:UDP-GlcNAc:undecaprenyl-phosphate GlcNAc-1-phosphate transferase